MGDTFASGYFQTAFPAPVGHLTQRRESELPPLTSSSNQPCLLRCRHSGRKSRSRSRSERRDQRSQPGHQVHRLQHDAGGAVAVSCPSVSLLPVTSRAKHSKATMACCITPVVSACWRNCFWPWRTAISKTSLPRTSTRLSTSCHPTPATLKNRFVSSAKS